jgi:hypothetical protein
MTDQVNILIVDDEEADGRALIRGLPSNVRGEFSQPGEVRAEDFDGLDLVLVDYDLGRWARGGEELGPSRRPLNGLALASVLREHVEKAAGDRPVAIALYSAQTEKISAGLADDVREHAIARLHNLEWVFDKRKTGAGMDLADRVAELGRAVRQLPVSWPDKAADSWEPVRSLLGWSDDGRASAQRWQEVRDCRPPVRELAMASQGLALLRWLAHRVLPYPTFLSDDRAVARRLGLPVQRLRQALGTDNDLAVALSDVRYRGALQDYVGPRWWRAGVNSLAIEWAAGPNGDGLHSHLERLAGADLPRLHEIYPVPCINHQYEVMDEPVDAREGVRVAPEDWPAFAEPAWTRRDLARTRERLRTLVLPEDKDLLEPRV